MFKKRIKIIVRAIQKGLAIVLLFILYVFGFGATSILSGLFNFRGPGPKYKDKNSFWIEAVECDESPAELTRQS
jgi:hypothetical protein